jgi:hypothetical protein
VTYAEHGASLAEQAPPLTEEQVTAAARIYAAELATAEAA